MPVRIEVDEDRCIGSGNCVYAAPGAFDLNDDSVAVVVDPSAATEEAIRTAAKNCPSRAITVHDD